MTAEKIKTSVEEVYGYMVGMRRCFHENPEPSCEEKETARRISEELTAMGIANERLDCHAVIGVIKGRGAGRAIALRADTDALKMTELTDCGFRSKREGVMHSCGHDAHTAALLGAAKVLSACADGFNGEVRLLFQPAEEVCLGAKAIIAGGYLRGVDSVFGLHVGLEHRVGQLGVTPGVRTAAADSFTVDIRGPKAIEAAASLISALQTIASREINPKEIFALSCCMVDGSSNAAVITGTCRYTLAELETALSGKLERLSSGICRNYRCESSVHIDHWTYPIINDPKCSALAQASVRKLFGPESLCDSPPGSISEDFSYYLREVPGCFGELGANRPDGSLSNPNHNPRFQLDERCLYYGAALFVQYALDFLETQGEED